MRILSCKRIMISSEVIVLTDSNQRLKVIIDYEPNGVVFGIYPDKIEGKDVYEALSKEKWLQVEELVSNHVTA